MKSDKIIDSRIEIKMKYVEEINEELERLQTDFPSSLEYSGRLSVDGSLSHLDNVRKGLTELYEESNNDCFNRSVIDILQLISELETLEAHREMDTRYRT